MEVVISTQNKWTDEDIELLRLYYPVMGKEELLQLFQHRTWSSILTKANKLEIRKRNSWTDEEDMLLSSIYANVPFNEVVMIMKGRTRDGIIHRAQKLGLNSFDHPIWTDWQKQYVSEHWETMPDEIIGMNIGKTKNAVKRMRNLMGLHRQDKTQRTYDNLAKYIRGNIYEWKKNSMKSCNYQCVITGEKNYEIHHLYPVNKLINDIYTANHFVWKPFEEYSENELQTILACFVSEQDKYPLGVCVRKDIHQLFHHLYGQYNTTEIQWKQFQRDYMNGLYNYRESEVA